jgi:hypothetical protein
LNGGAAISTQAKSANDGDRTASLSDLLYLLNSGITTSVLGATGNGGNIVIASGLTVLDHLTIKAQAKGGNGGSITIDKYAGALLHQNYVSSNTDVPIGIYVEGAGSHIELLHNHIHKIKTTLTTAPGDALGIAVYGTTAQAPISDLIIERNELDNLRLGFSDSLSLSGNVTLWQVTNNLIHDNNNIGINIEGYFKTVPNNPTVDNARNGLALQREQAELAVGNLETGAVDDRRFARNRLHRDEARRGGAGVLDQDALIVGAAMHQDRGARRHVGYGMLDRPPGRRHSAGIVVAPGCRDEEGGSRRRSG